MERRPKESEVLKGLSGRFSSSSGHDAFDRPMMQLTAHLLGRGVGAWTLAWQTVC